MALVRIDNQPEFGPYRATIGSDSDWFHGQIRIEPPFNPGDYLKQYFNGDGLELKHVGSDQSATLLNFVFSELPEDANAQPLAVEHVTTLLGFLGTVSSQELFKINWTQYDKSGE